MTGLGPFRNGIWLGMLGWIAGFGAPGMGDAFGKLVKAGQEMQGWFTHLLTLDAEIKSLGYPNMVGGMSFAPFDLIGDTLDLLKVIGHFFAVFFDLVDVPGMAFG